MHKPCACNNTGTCHWCQLEKKDENYRVLWTESSVSSNNNKVSDVLKKSPSLVRRIDDWLGAMATENEWRNKGGKKLTQQKILGRIQICHSCEHYLSDKDMCGICFCYIERRLLPPVPMGKSEMGTQACPVGKWNYVEGYKASGCGNCGNKK